MAPLISLSSEPPRPLWVSLALSAGDQRPETLSNSGLAGLALLSLSALFIDSAVMSCSVLLSSPLLSNVERLSALSGSFYFYEPRERMRGSGSGSPLTWESVNPNEADRLHYEGLDSFSLSLCSSLGGGALNLSEVEALEKITERKLWSSLSLLFVPSLCESGDYGGSTYQLSNAQALLEEFGGSPACRELIGAYGSYAVIIDPRYVSEELLEALEALEDYPVLDEEHLSQLEEELKVEAFNCWLEGDLRRLIEEVCFEALQTGCVREPEETEEIAEAIAEQATEDQLWDLLREADSDGFLWESEHNQMYCRLDRIDSALIVSAFLSEEVVR